MKIEIDYNGAFAVCRIEPMDEPGKMVSFNDADPKSQTLSGDSPLTDDNQLTNDEINELREEFRKIKH